MLSAKARITPQAMTLAGTSQGGISDGAQLCMAPVRVSDLRQTTLAHRKKDPNDGSRSLSISFRSTDRARVFLLTGAAS